MNWSELYSMQKNLDNYIESQHNLSNKDLFQEKCLALLVELGELANETRCFKFWSTKPRSDKEVIQEEYVDGIHFMLSLGLEKGYQYTAESIELTEKKESRQFNLVFAACNSFKQQPTERNYQSMFESYLQLGELLGFDEAAIQRAYFKKNEINYDRQNQGY